MKQFYTGDPCNWRSEPPSLPPSPLERMVDPHDYIPDDGVVQAVNVALILGQPLLVTGEPGTGKTQLAYSMAAELCLGEPLKFEVKSTTTASDLFYSFDSLRQFRDANLGLDCEPRKYLKLNALGKSLALANTYSDVQDIWPSSEEFVGPRRTIVLIDEVDKAPRDVPNDILNEMELLFFKISEADDRLVRAKAEFRPIIVFTSNSERQLPDTFLRRCVFYDIPFPGQARLKEIVARRISKLNTASPLLQEVISLFETVRDPLNQLEKPPGTAELLNWVYFLTSAGLHENSSLHGVANIVNASMTSLLKTEQDQQKGVEIIREWLEQ